MKDFNPHQLQKYYRNLSVIDDDQFSNYAVLDNIGNHIGQILYMGNHEWRYLVDNFPANKKFFTNNLPILTKEQFEADIQRTGLKLLHAAGGWEAKAESHSGFVCLPESLTDEKADEMANAKFNEIKDMFENDNRDLSITERETLRLRWCKNRAKAFQEIYLMFIKAHAI